MANCDDAIVVRASKLYFGYWNCGLANKIAIVTNVASSVKVVGGSPVQAVLVFQINIGSASGNGASF